MFSQRWLLFIFVILTLRLQVLTQSEVPCFLLFVLRDMNILVTLPAKHTRTSGLALYVLVRSLPNISL